METVSEPLTDILTELDFEETPDAEVCENIFGCSNKAVWREIMHTHCPHDGISAVFCDPCKKYSEYLNAFCVYVCNRCEAIVYKTTWERL